MEFDKIPDMVTAAFPEIGSLEEEDRLLLLRHLGHRSFQRSEIIWKRGGNHRREVLLITSGVLEVRLSLRDSEDILLFPLGRFDLSLCSAPALTGNINMHFCLKAGTDLEAIGIPESVFLMLEEHCHGMRERTDSILAVRLEMLMRLLEEISMLPLEERLEHYLERYSHALGKREVEKSQEEIAGDIGTRREVVARILRRLEEAGRLERRRERVLLP